ncbi:hypothetical protein ABZ496_33445 [Nocardia rhamnosiphila]|uniref:Uncharacterized protein n=1 Tax=Nocardia rhamnosiphila TaxID=426716 RepID=A0ABV2WYT0_9NOCA
MTGTLKGKVTLIAGPARGQGRAHAVAMARSGADIIACDIDEDVATAPFAMVREEDLRQTAADVESLGRRIVARGRCSLQRRTRRPGCRPR